jgi:23S rRNA pseudouridine1911/1915/1917 synthase
VAKTLEAQTALIRQLQSRSVERIYQALVHGEVTQPGMVEAPIGRDRRMRTRMAVAASGKPALTRYRPEQRFDGATLLECRLATGRTHQIRVHLHAIGHPLVGDPTYRLDRFGRPPWLGNFARQALHAARLAFDHPASAERVSFSSSLPEDMRDLLLRLGGRP